MPQDPQIERVIFIAGADHSGSTMLGCALGADEDPFRHLHVGELYALFNPGNRRVRVPYRPWFWRRLKRQIDPVLGARSAYQEIVALTGAQAIVDSSKNLAWLKDQSALLEERGIPLDIVIAMRPNAALIHSALRRDQPEAQAVRSVLYYRRLVDTLRDHPFRKAVTVDCDAFCRDPSAQLRSLCAAIDVPYFPGKELYWNYKHYHLFGASIQRQQIIGAIPGGYREPIGEKDPQLDSARKINLERGLEPIGDILRDFNGP